MWYVVGSRKGDVFDLKLVWAADVPIGYQVCIELEKDKEEEPRFILIVDECSYQDLYADVVSGINELDEEVSGGEGVADRGQYDMTCHYGFYVDPETKKLVDPSPYMWFRGIRGDNVQLGEQDLDTIMFKWKCEDTDAWAVFKVSGLESENIELISSNVELPPDFRHVWNKLVIRKGDEDKYTDDLFLDHLKANKS